MVSRKLLNWWMVLPLFVLIPLAVDQALSSRIFNLSLEILQKVQKKYGEGAVSRIQKWEKLIAEGGGRTDLEKLKIVNDFFNTSDFVTDILLWKQKDYWATPVEFLAKNAGDCEDFTIAKYFTLRAIGIDEKKLFLTYVKAVRLNEAHMVLAYYRTPHAEPLILDNLIEGIKPAGQRSDLLPVYRFNGSGLWLAKQRGAGKYIGKPDRLKRWQDLLQRIPDSLDD